MFELFFPNEVVSSSFITKLGLIGSMQKFKEVPDKYGEDEDEGTIRLEEPNVERCIASSVTNGQITKLGGKYIKMDQHSDAMINELNERRERDHEILY